MIKKIVVILSIVLIFTNSVQAANWISVKAGNGKSALLDTENLEIIAEKHYAKYWVKSLVNGYMYRYYMMSDYTARKSCIIETYKYDKSGKLVESSINSINLEVIIPDTLNEALYKKVCQLIKENPLSISTNDWITYFNSVQKQIAKEWKPKYEKTSANNLITSVLFNVNNNGEVISKEIINKSNNKKYDKSVNDAISNLSKFQSLPASYDGKIQFVFDFKYTIRGNKSENAAIINDNGVGIISLSKEKFRFGKAIIDGICSIIALPFVILGVLLEA